MSGLALDFLQLVLRIFFKFVPTKTSNSSGLFLNKALNLFQVKETSQLCWILVLYYCQ